MFSLSAILLTCSVRRARSVRLLLVVSTLADFFYQGRVRIPAENLTCPVWSELKEDLLRLYNYAASTISHGDEP